MFLVSAILMASKVSDVSNMSIYKMAKKCLICRFVFTLFLSKTITLKVYAFYLNYNKI